MYKTGKHKIIIIAQMKWAHIAENLEIQPPNRFNKSLIKNYEAGTRSKRLTFKHIIITNPREMFTGYSTKKQQKAPYSDGLNRV